MEKVDPITLEVMRNAFYSISDEMLASLVRTGFSTNIKDRGDCSSAIYTSSAEEVGQCAKGTPLHIGTLPACVKTVIDTYRDRELNDGDHIIMNIPFPGGPAHLNDVAESIGHCDLVARNSPIMPSVSRNVLSTLDLDLILPAHSTQSRFHF